MSTLANAMDVLKLIARLRRDITVTDVVTELGLPKSSASRTLSMMASYGFLDRDAATRAYRPGGVIMEASYHIKFLLDWRFEGPAALFLQPVAKGYFKDAKLDVTIDAGTGSGAAVQRVASGTYDMGFADLAALMEFHANNPDAANKPVAVMMVYNNTPAAVMALKKSGIKKPADLNGKKLGAPVFDAGRRGFPIFQKANNIGAVTWVSMDPPLRETMLARGDIDAITGFSFTSLLNLEARGVKLEDVVTFPTPTTA
jgi:NitT/TauT family transport system substrate-binding protein